MAKESTADAQQRLILAATELMMTKAPSLISGREIAKLANVNYGLIHHYFGTKYEIFQQALRRLADEYIQDMESLGVERWVTISAVAQHEGLWRSLAQLALDDVAREHIEWPYPILRRDAQLRTSEHGDRSPVDFAVETVFTLGWVAFRNLIGEAYGLDEAQLGSVAERLQLIVEETASQAASDNS